MVSVKEECPWNGSVILFPPLGSTVQRGEGGREGRKQRRDEKIGSRRERQVKKKRRKRRRDKERGRRNQIENQPSK